MARDVSAPWGFLWFGGGGAVGAFGRLWDVRDDRNMTFPQLNNPLQNLRKHAKDAKTCEACENRTESHCRRE